MTPSHRSFVRLRPLALAALAPCFSACVDLDFESEPPVPPQPLPAHCQVVADPVAQYTFYMEALPNSSGGWTVVWREFPDELDDPVAITLAMVDVGADASVGEVRRIELFGDALLEDVTAPLAYALVGDQLLAIMGRTLVVAPLAAPETYRLVDLPNYVGVHMLPLDDERAAILSSLHAPAGTLRLSYQVIDVPTGTFGEPIHYARLSPYYDAAPGMTGLLGQSVRLFRLGADELAAFWVADPGHTLRAMRIDEAGAPLSWPVSLVHDPDRRLFVPSAARLGADWLGLVWTGDAGTEVKYRSLPADLDSVAQADGIQVNVQHEGSQEYARLVSPHPGLGLVAWVTLGNGLYGRWFDASWSPNRFDPLQADFDLTGGCAARVSGAPALAHGPFGSVVIWMDDGWEGATRILVSQVDTPQ